VAADHLSQAMRALSDNLSAAFRSSALLSHNLTKGETREQSVAELLRPYIPGRFAFSSGEIVNSTGVVSRQQDVILVDALNGVPLLAFGKVGVHPIETVYGCLEIKSRADASEVASAVASLGSVKALQSNEKRQFSTTTRGALGLGVTTNKPFTGIVAYELRGKVGSVAQAFFDANADLDPHDRCDSLVVMDKFVCLYRDGEERIVPPEIGSTRYLAYADELSLLVFYVWFHYRLTSYHAPPLDLLRYIASDSNESPQLEMTIPEATADGGTFADLIEGFRAATEVARADGRAWQEYVRGTSPAQRALIDRLLEDS